MTSKPFPVARIFALIITVVLGAALPAAAQTQAVITNDTVTLGVNQEGHLNVVVDPAQAGEDAGWLGLQLTATGNSSATRYDGLRHLGPREGWGVAVPGTGVVGFVNHEFVGPAGWVTDAVQVVPFPLSVTGDRATSVVRITDGFNPILEVTHDWFPLPAGDFFTPYLYQANVTIRNLTSAPVGAGADGLRYRRVMDWDAEPTFAEAYVTIAGLSPAKPPFVRFTSDDGFETSNPLQFDDVWASNAFPPGSPVDVFLDDQLVFGAADPQPCGFTTDFVRCGYRGTLPFVADHGALFDFAFPALAAAGVCDDPVNGPCDSRTFTIFYGAAPTRAAAELALYTVGVEVYSLANCQGDFRFPSNDPAVPATNTACDPVAGTPVTFIFGANGLSGSSALGDVFGTAFVDANRNGGLDSGEMPLAGVTLTVTGTDVLGNPVTRTVVTDGAGAYDVTALPRGTYTISAASPVGGHALSAIIGGAAFAVTIDDPFPQRDVAYVTGSIAGAVFTDTNGSGGAFEPGVDTGLAGVLVTLSGTDFNGAPVSRTATTAGDGTYAFAALLSGTYSVSAPAAVSGLPGEPPSSMSVVLGAGQDRAGVDFGYCATTVTAIASSLNPSVFGQAVTFTAAVTACGNAVTSGTVTFKDGTTGLGGAVAVDGSGHAAIMTASLTTGGHPITAEYTSGTLLAGSSAGLTQTVNPAATVTTVTSSLNPSTFRNAVTFTATVTSAAGAVSTGSVTFTIDGGAGTSVSVDATGHASLTISTLEAGSHGVVASYGGSATFAPSTGSLTQIVNPAATTTTVTSSPNPSTAGQAVTFTAGVTSPAGAVTGAVTFLEGSTVLAGPVPLNTAGQAAFTTSALAAGSHVITAQYGGAPNFTASSGTVTQAVNTVTATFDCGAPSSIAFNFNGTPIAAGRSLWFNSVLKVNGLGSTPVTLTFRNISVHSPDGLINVSLPDSTVTFSPATTVATTTFTGGAWVTQVPSSGLAGNVFFGGGAVPVPGGLPGGIKNVTWTGQIGSDTAGVSVKWQWAAAVYTTLGANAALGVKPVDDTHASVYQNSDHAGTPENFKPFTVGGATGGGASNDTGSYSATVNPGKCQ